MLSNYVAVQKIENADDLRAELQRLGADLSASNHLVPALKVQGVVPKLARFVYQEMMLEGGWVALPARMNDRSAQPVTILIGGTTLQLEHLIVRLRTQNTDELNFLADELEQILL
jgi:hypothetical protein